MDCPPTCKDPTPFCVSPGCKPGCNCPDNTVFNEDQAQCVNLEECPPVLLIFELKGVTYPSGSIVRLSEIGEGNNALLFHTDYSSCCQAQRSGECYQPNGELVKVRAQGDQLFRNRGNQLLRLNGRSSGNAVESGLYCCEVPTSADETDRICVDIDNDI